MPRFDPVASLRVWAVETDVAGRVLRIPPLPAADWLPPLMTSSPLALLELADDIDVGGLLLDKELTAVELTDALNMLIESATGRTPWAAILLASFAREHWHVIGGELARAGVNFESISIGAALDAIYTTLCRLMDDKGIAKLNRALDHPPVDTIKPQAIRPPRGAKPLPASAEQYVRVRPKTVLHRPQDRQAAQSAQPTAPHAPHADSDPPASAATPLADHPPTG